MCCCVIFCYHRSFTFPRFTVTVPFSSPFFYLPRSYCHRFFSVLQFYLTYSYSQYFSPRVKCLTVHNLLIHHNTPVNMPHLHVALPMNVFHLRYYAMFYHSLQYTTFTCANGRTCLFARFGSPCAHHVSINFSVTQGCLNLEHQNACQPTYAKYLFYTQQNTPHA